MEVKHEETSADTIMADLDTPAPEKVEDSKTTYKSFKKKYRKMRLVFDEKMRESNSLYLTEQRALDTVKRLALSNNQTLDLLLEVNDSAQIPAEKRFDLSVSNPNLTPIPPIISRSELAAAAELSNTDEGKILFSQIQTLLAENEASKSASESAHKSLSTLMNTVPHLSQSSPQLPKDLVALLRSEDGQGPPLRYLPMDQLDQYLAEADAQIGQNPAPPPPPPAPISYTDLSLRNPHSVYNWLRLHEPRVFLQDGEGSEKSSGKPGALRGAGKRIPPPAPSKPDVLEFVEEDGAGYEGLIPASVALKGGKRKRGTFGEEEDGGYHPKAGRVEDGKGKRTRAPRKKKEKGEEGTGSARKRKPKVSADVAPATPTPVAVAAVAGEEGSTSGAV